MTKQRVVLNFRPDARIAHAWSFIQQTSIMFCPQSTYDRLLLDREAIVEMSEVDVPFRNRWSDRLWLGTVKVRINCCHVLCTVEAWKRGEEKKNPRRL